MALWMIAAVAAVGLLVAAGERATDRSPKRGVVATAGSPSPPTSAAVLAGTGFDGAEALVEQLIAAVNTADSATTLETLAASADGLGRAEWPLLTGDIGWWSGEPRRVLDRSKVTDFVRYFRTIPSGLIVAGCASQAVALGDIEVSCDYVAFGGVPRMAGTVNAIEGSLVATVRSGLIVDVRNSDGGTDPAWATFADWVSVHHPDEYAQSFVAGGDRGSLAPTYNGSSALRHAELASEFAESEGRPVLPLG